MGAAQGKHIHPEDYEVVSDDGEDIELSVEADELEAEEAPQADETPEADEEVKIEEAPQPKKKKRRNRRGKKAVEDVKADPEPEPCRV